jgi:hypothetical protein
MAGIQLTGFIPSYVPSTQFQFNKIDLEKETYQMHIRGPRRTSSKDQQISAAEVTKFFQAQFPKKLPAKSEDPQGVFSGFFQFGDTVFSIDFQGKGVALEAGREKIVQLFKGNHISFFPDQVQAGNTVHEFALEEWMITPLGKKEKDAHPTGTVVANLPMHLGGTLREPCQRFIDLYRPTQEAYLRIDSNPITSEVDVVRKSVSLAPKEGVYLDFGFGTARTSNEIARQAFPLHAVYAFDVGTGSPTSWERKDKIFSAGLFAFKLDEQGRLKLPYHDQNVYLSLGLFQEELPRFAKALAESGQKIAFMCIDSETYESSECIFTVLGSYLQDNAVIYFDEIQNFEGWENGHEHLAFKNFLTKFELEATVIAFNPTHQQAAFRITKIEPFEEVTVNP